MAIDIRMPNITATSEKEQLLQIKSYLYQFAEQLNWALNTLESNGGISVVAQSKGGSGASNSSKSNSSFLGSTNEEKEVNFTELKSLIIKSADIVNAYSERIKKQLKSEYVALSDFGTYLEANDLSFTATAEGIDTLFKNIQMIEQDGGTTTTIGTDAWVSIGIIGTQKEGNYLYGMEIGQTNEVDGVETKTKFAQYTTEGVYLFDGVDDENWSAKIANKELVINNAYIKNQLRLGGFVQIVDANGGVVEKWMPMPIEESEK